MESNRSQVDPNGARFRMQGPGDLLDKLEYDIQRVSSARTRREATYATVDAATTAWSIVDWIKEALGVEREWLPAFKTVMIEDIFGLEACRLIATGAKHYVVSIEPRAIGTFVLSSSGTTIDKLTGTVVEEKSALAMIDWNKEVHIADELLERVHGDLFKLLDKAGLLGRSWYLDEFETSVSSRST